MNLDLSSEPLNLQRVLMDAVSQGVDLYGCELYAFPQTWSNTSCGHGGMAGQAFTTAMTYAIVDHDASMCWVYTRGEFLYTMTDRARYEAHIRDNDFPEKSRL